jgi:hypothetical protein
MFEEIPLELNIKEGNSSTNNEKLEVDHEDERKNSVFHNFQKHLITVIKRLVHFSKDSLGNHHLGQLAFSLWLAFCKTRSQSKKICHIIFGVPNPSKRQAELKKLAALSEPFSELFKNNSSS